MFRTEMSDAAKTAILNVFKRDALDTPLQDYLARYFVGEAEMQQMLTFTSRNCESIGEGSKFVTSMSSKFCIHDELLALSTSISN
jgi:hypothetical protein